MNITTCGRNQKRNPNKLYETVVTAVITALVGGLIGYFVKMLGF